MTNLANLFRTLTDLSLDRDTFLGQADNTLERLRGVPSFWPEDYSKNEQAKYEAVREFYIGFYDGWNFTESRSRAKLSPAFVNGAGLGFRLRELRKEHGVIERCHVETLERLLRSPRAA